PLMSAPGRGVARAGAWRPTAISRCRVISDHDLTGRGGQDRPGVATRTSRPGYHATARPLPHHAPLAPPGPGPAGRLRPARPGSVGVRCALRPAARRGAVSAHAGTAAHPDPRLLRDDDQPDRPAGGRRLRGALPRPGGPAG